MKRLAILACAILALTSTARAAVAVYDLSFDTTGPSVNFSFLRGGYLVVDCDTNAVSSVCVLVDPDTLLWYYTTGLISGTFLEVIQETGPQPGTPPNPDVSNTYNVVVSSGNGTAADNTAMQLIGKTSGNVGVGGATKLKIAKKLRGYLMLSADDSVTVNDDMTITYTFGFAGNSKVTAGLQSEFTNFANDKLLDAAGTLDYLTLVLKNRGVNPEPTPTPTPTPTP